MLQQLQRPAKKCIASRCFIILLVCQKHQIFFVSCTSCATVLVPLPQAPHSDLLWQHSASTCHFEHAGLQESCVFSLTKFSNCYSTNYRYSVSTNDAAQTQAMAHAVQVLHGTIRRCEAFKMLSTSCLNGKSIISTRKHEMMWGQACDVSSCRGNCNCNRNIKEIVKHMKETTSKII